MFRSNFWESDFLAQNGFETLVTRMKEGRQTCRDLEEFLKSRAKAEEEFAKALVKIARAERGANESGTMKSSVELLRREAESEAGFHATHAQQLFDEANKLADFREKQREERKRNEEIMHKAHKAKADGFRRMQNCKSGYESKFRNAEKADAEFERLKFSTKAKEIEKARKNMQQCRQVTVKADEEYQNSVTQLETVRQSWEHDHRNTCDIFQRLEEEKLQYLRNALWVYANLGSDLFVKSDDSRETLRLSLEKCDPQSDITDFASRKSTGTQPLMPITYTPCGGSQGRQQDALPVLPTNTVDRPPTQDDSSSVYASISRRDAEPAYVALYAYVPRTGEEIKLELNDIVYVTEEGIDGWWTGRNTRTGKQGLFPANYVVPK